SCPSQAYLTRQQHTRRNTAQVPKHAMAWPVFLRLRAELDSRRAGRGWRFNALDLPGVEIRRRVRREAVPGIAATSRRRLSSPKFVSEPLQATTRYTWNTSAYSRFTLMPWVRATFQTYSAFA